MMRMIVLAVAVFTLIVFPEIVTSGLLLAVGSKIVTTLEFVCACPAYRPVFAFEVLFAFVIITMNGELPDSVCVFVVPLVLTLYFMNVG